MKLVAFDLEIEKEVTGDDWKSFRPLGISCAAINSTAVDSGYFVAQNLNEPALTKELAGGLVDLLLAETAQGALIVTVNGLGFDFDILAEESGRKEDCAHLAINCHCDLMVMALCRFGWPVGLQAFAEGAGVAGKMKEVTLKDGSVHNDMNGASAPTLWAAGERDAVISYLKEDVRSTLQAAETAVYRGMLKWFSKKGRRWEMALPVDSKGNAYLPTVAECLTWPVPDTGWMTDPIRREDLLKWTR